VSDVQHEVAGEEGQHVRDGRGGLIPKTMQPLWLQIVVAVCAMVGAALSIFNLVRVRERVAVSMGEVPSGNPGLVVVNHSSFPIEIKQVGHSIKGSEAPLSLDRNEPLPYELPKTIAARSLFTFPLTLIDTLHHHVEGTDYFYATTATGTTYTTESLVRRWKRRATAFRVLCSDKPTDISARSKRR